MKTKYISKHNKNDSESIIKYKEVEITQSFLVPTSVPQGRTAFHNAAPEKKI